MLEARFLLRQYNDEIPAHERRVLAQEVRQLLSVVDHLRHQARTAAAEGKREEAESLYQDIEQLVVDVPGLSEERATLAVAGAVFSHPARGAGESAKASSQPNRRRFFGLWLAAAGCAGLAVFLFLIWPQRVVSPPARPLPKRLPTHTVVTAQPAAKPADPGRPTGSPHPLAAPFFPADDEQTYLPPEEPKPSSPSPQPTEPPPALRLGILQVKKADQQIDQAPKQK